MTLSKYQKSVASLQGLVLAAPILSKLFDSRSPVPFPPLGDDTAMFRFFALLLVGAAAALPYVIPNKWARWWVAVVLFCGMVASSKLYLAVEHHWVVPIHFPASEEHPDGMQTFVTRGSARDPGLKPHYSSMKDEDLIESTGLTDVRLESVYTAESLWDNRQKLFWSYVLALTLYEFFIGAIAKMVR